MRSVFALFRRYDEARAAVDALEREAFALDEVSAMAGAVPVRAASEPSVGEAGPRRGIAAGGRNGLDRLLGGRQAIRVEGVGEMVVGGGLASLALSAAASPSGRGGLQHALADLGVTEPASGRYLDGVRGGGLLLLVRCEDDRAGQAVSLLREHGAEGLISRS